MGGKCRQHPKGKAVFAGSDEIAGTAQANGGDLLADKDLVFLEAGS